MHLHFILISFKWRGHEQENWTRQIKLIRKRKMRTVEWSRVDSFLAFFCDISIAAININYAIYCRTICLVIGSNQISIHLCDAYTLSIQLVLCSRHFLVDSENFVVGLKKNTCVSLSLIYCWIHVCSMIKKKPLTRFHFAHYFDALHKICGNYRQLKSVFSFSRTLCCWFDALYITHTK